MMPRCPTRFLPNANLNFSHGSVLLNGTLFSRKPASRKLLDCGTGPYLTNFRRGDYTTCALIPVWPRVCRCCLCHHTLFVKLCYGPSFPPISNRVFDDFTTVMVSLLDFVKSSNANCRTCIVGAHGRCSELHCNLIHVDGRRRLRLRLLIHQQRRGITALKGLWPLSMASGRFLGVP